MGVEKGQPMGHYCVIWAISSYVTGNYVLLCYFMIAGKHYH